MDTCTTCITRESCAIACGALYIRAVAEDITSEVWLQASRQIWRFRGSSEPDFAAWIHGIAERLVHSYIRSRRRRRALLEAAVREGRVRIASEPERQASELDWPLLYAAIAALPKRDQAIVTLRIYQGLSFEQIGAVLRIQPANARVAFGRTLQKLRVRLGKSFGDT